MTTRRLAIIGLVLLGAEWTRLEACGDKFLLVGRGTGLNRAFSSYASMYPGSILLFAPGAKPGKSPSTVQKTLTRAGHQVRLVTDAGILAAELRAGKADIVLADFANLEPVEALATAGSTAKTLYVINETDKKRVEEIAKQFPVCLKRSDNLPRWLSVIEAEMKARVQAGTRVKRG
jgi:hypothetical protein